MSHILKQLQEYQQAAKVSAEWNDLVSVEEIAKKTSKTIAHVKDIMKAKNIEPVIAIGKSYMYKKSELLERFKIV